MSAMTTGIRINWMQAIAKCSATAASDSIRSPTESTSSQYDSASDAGSDWPGQRRQNCLTPSQNGVIVTEKTTPMTCTWPYRPQPAAAAPSEPVGRNVRRSRVNGNTEQSGLSRRQMATDCNTLNGSKLNGVNVVGSAIKDGPPAPTISSQNIISNNLANGEGLVSLRRSPQEHGDVSSVSSMSTVESESSSHVGGHHSCAPSARIKDRARNRSPRRSVSPPPERLTLNGADANNYANGGVDTQAEELGKEV